MSGWSTYTVVTEDRDSAEELRERFDTALEREPDELRDGETTVTGVNWGYGSVKVKNVLKNATDLWERAVVMECNDTSDSGSGVALETTDSGNVERIDTAHGVESARGHDAADDLRYHVGTRVRMR